MAGIGDLAFWLHLRAPRADGPLPEPVVPPGDGPLVLICCGGATLSGLPQALRQGRPGLRLGALGPVAVDRGDAAVPMVLPEPPGDPLTARALVDQLEPAALILTDGTLPAALIAACDDAGVPVTMVADRQQLAAAAARSVWRGARRGPMSRLSSVLVPDDASREAALNEGIAPARIEVVGTAAPVLAPLPCNMREHAALRPMLHDRHVWLAAGLPLAEAEPVLAAQVAILSARHRALLIVAPASADEAPAIAVAAEALGLAVARRAEDEEPAADVQVMVAEDCAELGLWYRLAPVVFMGGTLVPGDCVPRHPFEPAGLGATIVHGPHLPVQPEAWRDLIRAGATMRVAGPEALPQAIEELGAPDQAAQLAHAAWMVSTAGADVTRRIAETVLSNLPETAV